MTTRETSYSAILGVVLSNLRKEKGLEQRDVAERLGLSQASYSRLECGTSAFSVDQMFEAAKVLGVTSEEINRRVNNTFARLEYSGVKVGPKKRGSSSPQEKQPNNNGTVGKVLVGAALAAVIVGLLGNK